MAASSVLGFLSKLEQQIAILAQPRQLETVARRLKVLTSELDRLNELKSGRKDMSSLGLGLSGSSVAGLTSGTTAAHNNNNNNASPENKDGNGMSSDTEEKVRRIVADLVGI